MQKKHKIYINGRFLTQPITGVQRYSHELTKTLDHLLDSGEIDRDNFEFILIAPRNKHIHTLKRKHIRLEKVGIFKGHMWEQLDLPFYSRDGLLFCPGNTAPLQSLINRQKVVTTVHDLSYLYFPDAYSRAFKLLYNILIPAIFRLSNQVITVSNSEKAAILEHYPNVNERLKPIQNGGLSIEYQNKPDISESSKYKNNQILYVGSLSHRKNFQGIIDTLQTLNRDAVFHLVVAGASGSTFSQTPFKIPNELKDKINFLGQINDFSLLEQQYRESCCLLFPSFYEASPLPPMEAMACGCPVVASSIPSLMERCDDAALFCDPGNPEDIAQQVRKFAGNEDLRTGYVEQGLKHSKVFTWQECARKTFEMIKQCIQ